MRDNSWFRISRKGGEFFFGTRNALNVDQKNQHQERHGGLRGNECSRVAWLRCGAPMRHLLWVEHFAGVMARRYLCAVVLRQARRRCILSSPVQPAYLMSRPLGYPWRLLIQMSYGTRLALGDSYHPISASLERVGAGRLILTMCRAPRNAAWRTLPRCQ